MMKSVVREASLGADGNAQSERWRGRVARWCGTLGALIKLARTTKYERSDIFALLTLLMKLTKEERDAIFSMDRSRFDVGQSNATNREEWLRNALSALPRGARLLDAGAGECPFRKYCGHLEYVSQDLAKYDGTGHAGLQTGVWDTSKIDIVSDITHIPAPDASFDAILCSEVLEHVADPVHALEELGRLLKAGGTLIITAPFCSMTHFAPYHYSTGFNRYFYEAHLPRIGFEIVEITENGNFFEFQAQQLRQIDSFAGRYANVEPTRLEQYGLQVVLGMLQRISMQDGGSVELLNFGLHVRAVKR